jgi:triosephosphate isomerase
MKKTLIIANWKMHFNTHQASIYLSRLNRITSIHRNLEVVLAPTFLSLGQLAQEVDPRKFKLAAQNAYFKDEGAYTGEVSFSMLQGIVKYVIIGHSERRIYFNEDLPMIRDKVAAAYRNKLIPILCIGETKAERLANETKRVIHDQLTTALANLTSEEVRTIVIAYEPIWAISTFEGDIAKPQEIQKVIDYISYQISELYGSRVAQDVQIIYGGSVNSSSITSYLALDNCQGSLVGGASLNYEEFANIINKAYLLRK